MLGGRQLSDRPDWLISYVEPELVKRVVAAIEPVTREEFRSQYFRLDRIPTGIFAHRYELDLTEDDFEYTWAYFGEVRDFYRRATIRSLATVFQADQ